MRMSSGGVSFESCLAHAMFFCRIVVHRDTLLHGSFWPQVTGVLLANGNLIKVAKGQIGIQ